MFENDELLSLTDMFSHEFKTPLAIILNHANNIERRYTEGNMEDMDVHQAIDAIRRCCNGLSRLSNNMALVSGKNKIKADRFHYDVAEQLHSICFMSNELFCEKNIKINLNAKTDPAIFSADPDLIFGIMINLISNAIKYNVSEEKQVDITLNIINDRLIIQVADNGIGISKEEADKIFDMYYRSDNHAHMMASGMGLGLYIVSQEVKAHGGTIEALPKKKGTTFKIVIPAPESIKFGSPAEVVVTKEMLELGFADLLLKYL